MTTKTTITVKCESEETDLILESLENYASELSIGNKMEKSVKCRQLFERIKKATTPAEELVIPGSKPECEVCDD